ncbi:hypothetical protein T492DRAFT_849044 [Pavlovales sp. CCMP2436]|nr:hypothetical protein T492DRAFT_849044 [Pavlovales sp. CCMP2436]
MAASSNPGTFNLKNRLPVTCNVLDAGANERDERLFSLTNCRTRGAAAFAGPRENRHTQLMGAAYSRAAKSRVGDDDTPGEPVATHARPSAADEPGATVLGSGPGRLPPVATGRPPVITVVSLDSPQEDASVRTRPPPEITAGRNRWPVAAASAGFAAVRLDAPHSPAKRVSTVARMILGGDRAEVHPADVGVPTPAMNLSSPHSHTAPGASPPTSAKPTTERPLRIRLNPPRASPPNPPHAQFEPSIPYGFDFVLPSDILLGKWRDLPKASVKGLTLNLHRRPVALP